MAEPETRSGNPMPAVTVYIPSRDYGEFIGKAIASVRDQLYSDWELIIVDDASTDMTAAVAASACREDPARIRVVRFEEPCGIQRIANHVLGIARGRYIVRLDADDWFDESALLLMATKLDSDPSLGIVYGNYFYTDREGRVLGMERRRKLGVEDETSTEPARWSVPGCSSRWAAIPRRWTPRTAGSSGTSSRAALAQRASRRPSSTTGSTNSRSAAARTACSRHARESSRMRARDSRTVTCRPASP
jgi:glycosyltransferase involved in cell wall biosynthesis